MSTRWSTDEEKLLARMWLEVHDDRDIVNERFFRNAITERFNNQTEGKDHNKNMITAKWSRMDIECRNFNYIYKEVYHSSENNERLSNAMSLFQERYGGRGF